MRIFWYILIIMVAVIAGLFVAVWPQGPLWRMEVSDRTSLLRFQPVQGKLIGVEQVTRSNQHVFIWDSRIGHLLEEIDLNLDFPATSTIQIAPDLRSVLVSETIKRVGNEKEIEEKGWSVYDLTTGRRRFGPETNSYLNARPWSADARYFYSTRVDPNTHRQQLFIRTLDTGRVLCEFAPPEGLHSVVPVFAPDGKSVRLFWQELESDGRNLATGKKLVVIHELPSGKQLARIDLPESRQWHGVRDWSGQSFILYEINLAAGKMAISSLRVDPFKPDPLASAMPDPLLSTLEEKRNAELIQFFRWPDRIVEYGRIDEDAVNTNWFGKAREWLRKILHPDMIPGNYFVKVYNPRTGSCDLEMDWINASPTHLLNEGKLLVTSRATMNEERTKIHEVWDLQPSPPWFRALITGLSVATFLLLIRLIIGQWSKRRELSIATP